MLVYARKSKIKSSQLLRKNNKKADLKISIALMASFVVLTIQYFILVYFNLIGGSTTTTIQLMSKGFVGLAFLYALPVVLKRSSVKSIQVYFIASFIFLLHYYIFPQNRAYMMNLLFPVFFMSLPAFIYSFSIRDFSILKETMKKSSYVIFILGVLLGVLIFSGKSSAGTYSISLSYYMLLPTIMFIDELFNKLSIKVALFLGLSLLVILALGSRGAVLCVIVFVLLKIIKLKNKLTIRKVLTYTGLFGISLISYINLNRIFEKMYLILLNFGIKSRSLQLFLSNEVYLSGRDTIYKKVFTEFTNNSIFGIGIGGDRRILDGQNAYAHNLFLELLGNYGIAMGSIFIVALSILIINGLLIKEKVKYEMFAIWISLGFVHLMISSSYLTDIKFWIFTGLIINIVSRPKIYKNMEIGDNS